MSWDFEGTVTVPNTFDAAKGIGGETVSCHLKWAGETGAGREDAGRDEEWEIVDIWNEFGPIDGDELDSAGGQDVEVALRAAARQAVDEANAEIF